MADGKAAADALARFSAAGSSAELIAALEAIKTFAEQMGGGANVGGGLNKDAIFKMARVKKEELDALWTPGAAKALGDAARALEIMCECGDHPATHVCGECDGEFVGFCDLLLVREHTASVWCARVCMSSHA